MLGYFSLLQMYKLSLEEMVIPHQASAFVYFFCLSCFFYTSIYCLGDSSVSLKRFWYVFFVGLSHFVYKCLYCFIGWGSVQAAQMISYGARLGWSWFLFFYVLVLWLLTKLFWQKINWILYSFFSYCCNVFGFYFSRNKSCPIYLCLSMSFALFCV